MNLTDIFCCKIFLQHTAEKIRVNRGDDVPYGRVYLIFLVLSEFCNCDLENGFPWEIRNWKIEAKFGRAARQIDATVAGPGRMQVKMSL